MAKRVIAIIAFAGVIMASVYALRLFIRTMHNRVGAKVKTRELTWADGLVLAPLVAALLYLAFYPQGALRRSEGSVKSSLAATQTALISTPPPAALAPASTNPETAAQEAEESR